MARKKETTAEAVEQKTEKSNTIQENDQPQTVFIATVALPPQYSALNIREEPNGKIVGTLKDGARVTYYGNIELDNGETWAQISDRQFVNMAFLKTK